MITIRRIAIGIISIIWMSVAEAQLELYDDFTSASINSSIWEVVLPQTDSSVTQEGNSLTTTARGILGTSGRFNAPYVVTGVVTMLNSNEHFAVTLRSNLTTAEAYEVTGVVCELAMDGQGFSIYNYASAANTTTIAVGSYPFKVGKPYSYIIVDTGTSVSVSINGGTPISAATTFSTGSQIAFSSRELAGCASELDAVSIAAPGTAEPSTITTTKGDQATHLINISTRGYVGTGPDELIGGFVVSGTSPESVLIRGAGPSLLQFGVTGPLAAPEIVLSDSSGKTIATNTGWGNPPMLGASTVPATVREATAADFTSTGAFAFASGMADSAMVATLPPGSYTVQITGISGSTGIALVEAYDLP